MTREEFETRLQHAIRLTAALATVTAERDEARAQVEQLREALNAANEDAQDLYDMANDDSLHDWRCRHYQLDKGLPCNCGLEKVLKNHEDRVNEEKK